MTYAYLIDGLDTENRAKFDAILDQQAAVGEKLKAKRERDAVARLMSMGR